jgi:hypothetical protein
LGVKGIVNGNQDIQLRAMRSQDQAWFERVRLVLAQSTAA